MTSRRERPRGRRLTPFPWFGGKTVHLKNILPHLPEDATCFVDLFGGSAAVILNVKPYPVEVYNDLDEDVVNFFKVLRENTEELIQAISLTPYSRKEFSLALARSSTGGRIERARQFYVRIMQCRSSSPTATRDSDWRYSKLISERGMAAPAQKWGNRYTSLFLIAQRLKRIMIENRDFLHILRQYDGSETLFYVDPPYVHETRQRKRGYTHEMPTEDHLNLIHGLSTILGRFVLSGYDNEIYSEAIHSLGWSKVKFPPARATTSSNSKTRKIEVLWKNFSDDTEDLF